jgi:hypothetical protein
MSNTRYEISQKAEMEPKKRISLRVIPFNIHERNQTYIFCSACAEKAKHEFPTKILPVEVETAENAECYPGKVPVITDRSQPNLQARYCMHRTCKVRIFMKIPSIEAEIQLKKHMAL